MQTNTPTRPPTTAAPRPKKKTRTKTKKQITTREQVRRTLQRAHDTEVRWLTIDEAALRAHVHVATLLHPLSECDRKWV